MEVLASIQKHQYNKRPKKIFESALKSKSNIKSVNSFCHCKSWQGFWGELMPFYFQFQSQSSRVKSEFSWGLFLVHEKVTQNSFSKYLWSAFYVQDRGQGTPGFMFLPSES